MGVPPMRDKILSPPTFFKNPASPVGMYRQYYDPKNTVGHKKKQPA
jgi:hypothetical protein